MPFDQEPRNSERKRFDLLLPFYITNTLNDGDQEFMDAYIANNTSTNDAIRFAIRLRQTVHSIGESMSAQQSLNRFLVRFQKSHRTSLIQRIAQILRSRIGITPLMIAALTFTAQTAFNAAERIGWLNTSIEPMSTYQRAHFSLTLKEGASLAVIASLLEQHGARISHSKAWAGTEKVFIQVLEKSRTSVIIEELMESGLIEAIAILI